MIDQLRNLDNDALATRVAELVANDQASTVIATGQHVEEATSELSWRDDELVVVGTSRLAAPTEPFLGQRRPRCCARFQRP